MAALHRNEDEELRLFLQRVQEERFEQLIQFIANEEDVAETGFSPETAENFLSEEEKESKPPSIKSHLQVHVIVSFEGVESGHCVDA